MNYTICFPGLFMMMNVTQEGEKNREVNGLFSDFAAYTHWFWCKSSFNVATKGGEGASFPSMTEDVTLKHTAKSSVFAKIKNLWFGNKT